MITDNKPLGITSPIPGISSDVAGVPPTVPGSGGDGLTSQTSTVKTTDTPSTGSPSAPVNTDSGNHDNEVQQRRDAVAGIDHQIKIYRDWLDTEANRPETKEEREKRERREKSERIIAAVTDGIGALSNLYFTSQYAPNMYNHEKGSMTKAVDARLERMKAEREKNADKYLQFSLKLGDAENERAKTLRELEEQQERLKAARAKAKHDEEMRPLLKAIAEWQGKKEKGLADKAGYDAETSRVKSQYEPRHQEAELQLTNAKTATETTKQKMNIASAAAHNRSNVSEFSAWDEYGNEHKFRTKERAEQFAKQHGTWKEEDMTETTSTNKTDARDRKTTSTSTKTKKGGYPAKPIRGTMPGVKDNKSMPGTK